MHDLAGAGSDCGEFESGFIDRFFEPGGGGFDSEEFDAVIAEVFGAAEGVAEVVPEDPRTAAQIGNEGKCNS